MAITNKEQGVWGLDQVYNKINQGSIWEYTNSGALWSLGQNDSGQLGHNNETKYSSPTQIPGSSAWAVSDGNSGAGRKGTGAGDSVLAIRSDGSIWSWEHNSYGQLGQNNRTQYSSPVQVGSDTTWKNTNLYGVNATAFGAIKTDGTLWTWGRNDTGQLGQNNGMFAARSSPVQVGSGSDWSQVLIGNEPCAAIKTDGTLYVWGRNHQGQLGLNDRTNHSAPIQLGSESTWAQLAGGYRQTAAVKTDGTFWIWGSNNRGALGLNQSPSNHPSYANCASSPTQVPGTTWRSVKAGNGFITATKTDGTLWGWGQNTGGNLGQNNEEHYSSPIQIPGTNWDLHDANGDEQRIIKTDGTLWALGANGKGQLGQNNETYYSSPVQVPGTWQGIFNGQYTAYGWKS
jgi:alpha-tubulin suppressor-like RCC1 family protein